MSKEQKNYFHGVKLTHYLQHKHFVRCKMLMFLSKCENDKFTYLFLT